MDPPQAVFDQITAQRRAGQTALAYQTLSAYLPQYPQSSRARVLAGDLLLAPAAQGGNPAQAQVHYQEAIQMSDGGCRLQEGDEWRAIEGLALAIMFQGNYAPALPWLQRANSRWPTVTETIYNTACAYCQTGNLEMCHQFFVSALQNAASGQHPPFIADPGTVGHYVSLSQSDPDLAPLRADPRYQVAIAPYAGRP